MSSERLLKFILCSAVAIILFNISPGYAGEIKIPAPIERISPQETRSKVQAGEAILVCSYNDERCKEILLEGALLRGEFERGSVSLPKSREIIFYCG